jgi:carboxylesterase
MDSISSFLEFAEVTRRRLPEVRVPTLIIQSRKDTTVSPESADIIYNTISTPEEQKRIMWLDVTEHEMFRDCEKNAIVEAVVDYVRERGGPME